MDGLCRIGFIYCFKTFFCRCLLLGQYGRFKEGAVLHTDSVDNWVEYLGFFGITLCLLNNLWT